MNDRHHYTVFEVDGGHVSLAWNGRGITGLRLPDVSALAARQSLLRRLPQAAPNIPPPEINRIVEDIRRYFSGVAVGFEDVEVDLGQQEPFFLSIYKHIRSLGRGETTTYGAIAKALGQGPEMARDVGRAMASNPVPLIIPCHRVLAAGGKAGGFSAPGGQISKLKMLQIEGVIIPVPEKKPPLSQAAFDF